MGEKGDGEMAEMGRMEGRKSLLKAETPRLPDSRRPNPYFNQRCLGLLMRRQDSQINFCGHGGDSSSRYRAANDRPPCAALTL